MEIDYLKGYYVLSKHEGNKQPYHWVLKAPNHEVVLTSETYKSKQGALNGISSVQRHCEDNSNYVKKTAKDDKPYFNLRAKNYETIGTSETYESSQGRDSGINAVKNYGLSTVIKYDGELCETQTKKSITIIINGRSYDFDKKEISYEEVLNLANINHSSQNTMVIIVFERADNDQEGTLSSGDSIKVKEGMVFNVSTTNKS